MKRGTICLAALVATLVMGGCATGKNLIDYSSAKPTVDYSGRCSIAVAVHDLREQAAGGGIEVTQVGETPGAATRQTPLYTGSSKPFARVMADVVARAFELKGFETKVMDTTPSQAHEAVVEMAKGIGSTHSVVITVRKWWSAVHKNVIITYDLTLVLLDEGGAVIAEVSREGEENLTQAEASHEDEKKDLGWGAPPPAPVEPTVDADSFDNAETGDAPEEVASAAPEKEKTPDDNPAGNKSPSGLLADFLEGVLNEMLNDPSVPRVMKRFDTSKVQRADETGSPLEAAGSFGESK